MKEMLELGATVAVVSCEVSFDVTRRGLEYPAALLTGSEMRRATGRGWIPCANALGQNASDTSNSSATFIEREVISATRFSREFNLKEVIGGFPAFS